MGATLHALGESADRLQSLEDECKAERQRRNRLVVELVDQGENRSDICSVGRVSAKTVCTILGLAG